MKITRRQLRQLIRETIKMKDGEHCLMSKKGKNLGCYDTEKGAENREKEVNYFTHKDDDE